MTGAALKGERVVLREVLIYKGVRSRSPNGKVTRVELTLSCGHVENIKLSRLKHERFRCSECSEKSRDSRVAH